MNSRIQTIIFAAILIAVSGVGAYSQTMSDAIERVKAIKFLESDRSEVRMLLHEMIYDGTFDSRDDFAYGDFDVEVYYSTGNCDEDDNEVFRAEAGKVIRIVVSHKNDITIEQLGFSLSQLKKEQIYFEDESNYIYHDKKLGFAVKVYDDDVEDVILFPSVDVKTKTCDLKEARDFVRMDSWFGSKKLADRTGYTSHAPASVLSINLDRDIITALTPKKVLVSSVATDPDEPSVVYRYIVSGGRVIGNSSRVVWDLTNVPPGTYTITAGVDDGCGLCGQTKTKTVTVQ